MLYKKVPASIIYSRLHTATVGNFPSSIMSYVPEWLSQAMRSMRTRIELMPDKHAVVVENHQGYYPDDLIVLDGIEYKGKRLRQGTDKTFLKHQTTDYHYSSNKSDDYYKLDTSGNADWKGGDLVPITELGLSNEYYIPYTGLAHFSFEEGEVYMHYKKLECDEDGYPMIPDNNYYMTACVYYIIKCAVEAGIYQHGLPYSELLRQYEVNQVRAINSINYPSPDKSFATYESRTNLIPQVDDYHKFMI